MDATAYEVAAYEVVALDASTWPLFETLVEENGGVFGGCWCLGFHAAGAGGSADVPKPERKQNLVRTGGAHAALVLADGACVGWCQFGPPAELPRIKSRAAYDHGPATGADWRIACCFVGKGHRRRGVFTTALDGALGLIADAGGGLVEAFPEPVGTVAAGFLYNGALSTYEAAGFVRKRPIGKHRWVVTRVVDPR